MNPARIPLILLALSTQATWLHAQTPPNLSASLELVGDAKTSVSNPHLENINAMRAYRGRLVIAGYSAQDQFVPTYDPIAAPDQRWGRMPNDHGVALRNDWELVNRIQLVDGEILFCGEDGFASGGFEGLLVKRPEGWRWLNSPQAATHGFTQTKFEGRYFATFRNQNSPSMGVAVSNPEFTQYTVSRDPNNLYGANADRWNNYFFELHGELYVNSFGNNRRINRYTRDADHSWEPAYDRFPLPSGSVEFSDFLSYRPQESLTLRNGVGLIVYGGRLFRTSAQSHSGVYGAYARFRVDAEIHASDFGGPATSGFGGSFTDLFQHNGVAYALSHQSGSRVTVIASADGITWTGLFHIPTTGTPLANPGSLYNSYRAAILGPHIYLSGRTSVVRIPLAAISGIPQNNAAPVAQGRAYSLRRDGILRTATYEAGVLGNDHDPDGDPLEPSVVVPPEHGTLSMTEFGTFTYRPDPGFTGADTFTYAVSDGAASSTAAVTLEVAPPDPAPPVAQPESYAAIQATPLRVDNPALGLLGNDSDPTGDTLSASIVTPPSNGSLLLHADGTFVFTPAPEFTGTDSAVYSVSDGISTVQTTVSFTVTASSEPGHGWLNQDVGSPFRRGSATYSPIVVRAAGDSIGGAADEFHFLHRPAIGNFEFTARLDLIQTNPGWPARGGLMVREGLGADARFVAVLHDSGNTMRFQRRLSTGAAAALTTITGPTAPIWFRLVREGDTIRAFHSENPANGWTQSGSVTLGGLEPVVQVGFAYCSTRQTDIRRAEFSGASFVQRSLGHGSGNPPGAATPVANDRTFFGTKNTVLERNGFLEGVLVNDTDPDGDPLTALLVSPPEHGTLDLRADGGFTYTPPSGFTGIDTFVYSASDGVRTARATVAVVVREKFVPDPVAHWRFDETTGLTANDSAGNHFHAAFGSGATWVPGQVGGAIEMTGSANRGLVENSAAAAEFNGQSQLSISFWMRPTNMNGTDARFIVSKRTTSTDGVFSLFLWQGNRLHVDLDTNNDRFSSETVFQNNRWYHVALVFDGSQPQASRARIYVNGALDRTAAESSATLNTNHAAPVWIGQPNTNATSRYNGNLDDLRIYNSALGQPAIQMLMAGSVPPRLEGELIDWKLSHFTPRELADPAISGPAATPAGDGIANLVKYHLGIDPWIDGQSDLPVQALDRETGSLKLRYWRARKAPDATAEVLWSENLSRWSGEGVTSDILQINGSRERVEASVPTLGRNGLFLQLQVRAD